MRRLIIGEVNNEPNVLSRIVGIITRRKINIQSLVVDDCEDTNTSYIAITFNIVEDHEVDSLLKQINKQVEILKFQEVTENYLEISKEVVTIETINSIRNKLLNTDMKFFVSR